MKVNEIESNKNPKGGFEMRTTKERVDRLETVMMELAEAQMRTQVSLKLLSDEMKDFKEEMRNFKEEMKADRRRLNEQLGELANKWGTLVEDMVAPNIPRIAREDFGFSDIEFFAVRIKVRNKKERAQQREFDVIAVGTHQVIINETKSTPRIDYINEFIQVLGEIEDYFPEYAGKTILPIFASLHIAPDVVTYLTRNQIYAMAMGDETMELKNFQPVTERRTAAR